MPDAITIKWDSAGCDAWLDGLEQQAKAAARPAAQAGAQVLYNEVKRRVPVADAPHVLKSGRVIQPGALDKSIYQVYSEDHSNALDGRAVYHVSYNARKAPHGALVEFGHVQKRAVFRGKDGRWYTSKTPLPAPRRVAARPYLRPAWDAVNAAAIEAAKARWIEEMRKGLTS